MRLYSRVGRVGLPRFYDFAVYVKFKAVKSCLPTSRASLFGGANAEMSWDPHFHFDEVSQRWMQYDRDQQQWVYRDTLEQRFAYCLRPFSTAAKLQIVPPMTSRRVAVATLYSLAISTPTVRPMSTIDSRSMGHKLVAWTSVQQEMAHTPRHLALMS